MNAILPGVIKTSIMPAGENMHEAGMNTQPLWDHPGKPDEKPPCSLVI